jgi:hypothetical protein
VRIWSGFRRLVSNSTSFVPQNATLGLFNLSRTTRRSDRTATHEIRATPRGFVLLRSPARTTWSETGERRGVEKAWGKGTRHRKSRQESRKAQNEDAWGAMVVGLGWIGVGRACGEFGALQMAQAERKGNSSWCGLPSRIIPNMFGDTWTQFSGLFRHF